ncbi:MAG: hypothetical protein K2M44_06370, partial [Clostridia bacterium]|nr:hypothetical protein [Clostridia bacterium]
TQEYYDLLKLHVIAEYVMIGVTAFIVILVIVLIAKVGSKKRDKRRDSSDKDKTDDINNV